MERVNILTIIIPLVGLIGSRWNLIRAELTGWYHVLREAEVVNTAAAAAGLHLVQVMVSWWYS